MMYTKEWAFIHIPKTSGMNFKKHLKENRHHAVGYPKLPSPRFMYIHQPISYWVENGTVPQQYQWITIVRNPYSRLVSWYYFLKQTTIDPVSGKHIADPRSTDLISNFETFDEFVNENVLGLVTGGVRWEEFKKGGGLWRMWWTQSKFLEGDHKVKIFHIEDLSELEDFVGFKFAHTRHNNSFHNPWQDYYTEETKDVVYERYREDFENFGYDR